MSNIDSFKGQTVLALANVIGMVDMVALPLWIGVLMQYYKYTPSQAGITVTLFLLGVVVSSVLFAPRFNRVPKRLITTVGFALGAACFSTMYFSPVAAESFQKLAVLHVLAGLGVGSALTFIHGAMGRSKNPHRSWAISNVVLGVFAVVFLGGIPQLLLHVGPTVFFAVLASTMLFATVLVGLMFPTVADNTAKEQDITAIANKAIPKAAWFIIAVIMCLTLNQAMVFSFVERIGAERGFGIDRVNLVLIALGLVNLTPGVLAAVLEKKWSPIAVGIAGPFGQAVLAVVMTSSLVFGFYAVSAALYVFMVIFTHTFLFGMLSKLDASGRVAAATPAMMMIGSCIGPALGGTVVQNIGYPGLGWVACVVALIAMICMALGQRALAAKSPAQLANA